MLGKVLTNSISKPVFIMTTGFRPLRHYLIPLRFEYLRVALKYSVYAGLGDVGALVFVTYSYIAGRIRLKSMKAHRNAFSECMMKFRCRSWRGGLPSYVT